MEIEITVCDVEVFDRENLKEVGEDRGKGSKDR